MAGPETAAIDATVSTAVGKPGKRPDAGAHAGAFTAELASLTAKLKHGRLAAAKSASSDPADGTTSHSQTKVGSESKTTLKVSSKEGAASPEAKVKIAARVELETGDPQILAGALSSADAPPKHPEALLLSLGSKPIDPQLGSKAQGQGKALALGAVDTPSGLRPELNALIEASANPKSTAQQSSLNAKHEAKFEELIAQHQSGSPNPGNPPHANVSSSQTASGPQIHPQGISHRNEAAQTQTTADPSQAQSNLLLRAPEAGSSSTSFESQLDAPTLARTIEHVAYTIARKSESGERNFEIRMDPPELGRVDVKLNVSSDGRVSAILAVDRLDTLDLLTRDARALEHALKDTGLDVGSGALSFSLRDQNASGAFRDSGFASTSLDADEQTETQVPAAEQIWLGAPKTLLDIKV